jgi:hypothetical protein
MFFGAKSCMLYSRSKKENRATSKSAREAATVRIDKVCHFDYLPSVVIQDTQELRIHFLFSFRFCSPYRPP